MLMLSSRGVAGLGASSPAITSLQNALIALAQASGRPAINPGAADGILGPKTMNALAAGLQAAADKIPKDSVATAVSFALTLGATTTQAINTVNSYAPQLTLLIKSATGAYVTGVLKPHPTTPDGCFSWRMCIRHFSPWILAPPAFVVKEWVVRSKR